MLGVYLANIVPVIQSNTTLGGGMNVFYRCDYHNHQMIISKGD